MASDIGTGATIVFGTTLWAGNIMSISWSGVGRPKIKTSHLGTAAVTGHTYIPGDIYEPGELEVEYQQDTGIVLTATAAQATYKTPPYKGPLETITVTMPKATATISTGAKFAGSGFITDLNVDAPLEELITGRFTVAFSGSITHTSAV